jgi:hypothetical protein
MSDYEKGFHSNTPSAYFPSGSQQWAGAEAAERLRRQRAEAIGSNNVTTYTAPSGGGGYGSTSTGDGGGLGGLVVLGVLGVLVAGYFGAFKDHSNTTTPKLSLSSGSSYRVRGCQFSGSKPINSHFLVENERVMFMKTMPGGDLQVSAFRSPYDGTSALGTISATCIKSAV